MGSSDCASLLIFLARKVNQAARVQRRDQHRPGRGEDLLGRLDVGYDIVLLVGFWIAAVPQTDAALHAYKLGLCGDFRIPRQRGFQVGHGPNGNERHGLGRIQDRADDRPYAVPLDFARVTGQVIAGHPGRLRPAFFGLGDPYAHRNIRPLGHFEHFGDDLRPILGIARIGNNELDLDLRRFQEQCQGPGVVDIAADIRIEDHRDLVGASRSRRRSRIGMAGIFFRSRRIRCRKAQRPPQIMPQGPQDVCHERSLLSLLELRLTTRAAVPIIVPQIREQQS